MSLLSSRLLKRLAAGLASGMVFAGMVGVGYWAGLTARSPRPIPKANGSSGGRNVSPQADPSGNLSDQSGTVGTATAPASGPRRLVRQAARSPASKLDSRHGPRHDGTNTEDDSALFAALDRLERRMAAGMIRARDSVVALEYTAADGPPGSRRVATGVVINSGGDVLSVRIDPPAPTSAPVRAQGVGARCRSWRRKPRAAPPGKLGCQRSRERAHLAADCPAGGAADPDRG